VESVQNAIDQARNIAARLTGRPAPFAAVPWFWSDQGPLKLQMAGLAPGHDTAVLRGDPGSGAFSVFCFAKDRLLAVESVNMPGDHMAGRRLLAAGAAITPAQAADTSVDLKTLLSRPPA
jgi:3-phenylpropionate/trans-cinnamate dioxygenase ferredoxin reductase subunit